MFLEQPIFKDLIFPFILLFALVFAILEKSKLLGNDKHQINAIIALVLAGISVTFSEQVAWLRNFSVFLALGLVILFVFMLLYSFAFGTTDGDPFKESTTLKKTLGGIAFIAVVIAALVITRTWDGVVTFFTQGEAGANAVMIIIIVAAIIAVIYTGGAKTEKDKEKKDK